MVCRDYSLDVSAVQVYIKNSDGSLREQIRKKLLKVKQDPMVGETKSHESAGIRAVKVNKQKIVILYKVNQDLCQIIFICIGSHDDCYKRTF